MARLDVYDEGRLTQSIDLNQDTWVVGRDESCDIVLRDPLASRAHCKIYRKNGSPPWIVDDLSTENGTRVDGVGEVHRELSRQSVILVGRTLLVFGADAQGEAPTGPPAWARKGDAPPEGPTAHLPPAMLARIQGKLQGRAGPHLLRLGNDEVDVHPLDPDGQVDIGDGPHRIKVNPSGDKLRAQILGKKGRFVIKAAGLLGRVTVDGRKVGRAELKPGVVCEVGGVEFEFHPGVLADSSAN